MNTVRILFVFLGLFSCKGRGAQFEFFDKNAVCKIAWQNVEGIGRRGENFEITLNEQSSKKLLRVSAVLRLGELKITSQTGKSISLNITDMDRALPEVCPHVYWDTGNQRVFFNDRSLILLERA